ncbi:MAG: hypothetical protein LC106_03365, partial [Burkholderiales bacterium]|nr:hypothetical protein [Burkholderiales bacterium]
EHVLRAMPIHGEHEENTPPRRKHLLQKCAQKSTPAQYWQAVTAMFSGEVSGKYGPCAPALRT